MTREKYFKKDLERLWAIRSYESEPGFRKFKFFLLDYGIHFVAIYRLRRYAQNAYRRHRLLGFPLHCLAFMLSYRAELVHNIHIESYDG